MIFQLNFAFKNGQNGTMFYIIVVALQEMPKMVVLSKELKFFFLLLVLRRIIASEISFKGSLTTIFILLAVNLRYRNQFFSIKQSIFS